MMFTDLTIGLPHIKSGALRGLATTRLQRSTLLPDLPTLDEAGVKDFNMDSWAGLFAPAKTSPAIIELLQNETSRFLLSGELRVRLQELGLEPVVSKPAELQAWVQSQVQRWGRIIQAQRIALD